MIAHVKAVCFKDWKELARSPQALVPCLILPVAIAVVFPLAVVAGAPELGIATDRFAALVSHLPQGQVDPAWTAQQRLVYALLTYLSAPIFLLIPVVVAASTAAQSFAGEKERRTIEALLYTPISDADLVLAKVLAAFLPAVAATIVSFAGYAAVANRVAQGALGRAVLPTMSWSLLVLCFAPAVSFLSLAAIVFVSQRARSAWEAQQVSALVILPIVALAANQAILVAALRPGVVVGASAVTIAVDVLAFRWIVRRFDRERLVTRFT